MENLPKTENKLESQEGGPMAELEAAVTQLDAHATQLEREGSDVDISEETAERVERKTSKIKNLIKVASMGLALYGSIKVGEEVKDYATSRYEITSQVGQDGKIEYSHEDPETTRILEFTLGSGELSEEDKMQFYRELVRSELLKIKQREKFDSLFSEYGLVEAGERSNLTADELRELDNSVPSDLSKLKTMLRSVYAEQDIILYDKIRDDIDACVDQAFEESTQAQVEYDPELEKIIWEMQKRVGSPRIRWSTKLDSRASYSIEDNTIYITPGINIRALGASLVAENAHAEQFNNDPVRSRVRILLDEVRIAIRSVSENKTRYQSQLGQYELPGSIEYKAHKEIEPQLMKEALEEEIKLKSEN